MGNRAVITTRTLAGFCENSTGVYIHWNGGRDSVTAFLKYCELQGFTSPETNYAISGWVQFAQIVSNYFGGQSTVCIDTCKNLDCDNGDNGVYLIENWQIVGREFMRHEEQNEYPLKEMLLEIDEKQPAFMQIRKKILDYFSNPDKVLMDISGNPEAGFRVVQIVIDSTGRHFSTLYQNAEFSACLDWMNAYASKNGFHYDGENTRKFVKAA